MPDQRLRMPVARGAHAQRSEDALLQKVLVGLSAGFLDDHAQQIVAGVAVSPFGAGREIERFVLEHFQQLVVSQILAAALVEFGQAREALDARGVIQQLAHGHRVVARGIVGQELRQLVVERQLFVFGQHHDGRGGELLGDRAQPIDRLGRGRHVVFQIGEAIAAGQHDVPVLDDAYGVRRHVPPFDVLQGDRVDRRNRALRHHGSRRRNGRRRQTDHNQRDHRPQLREICQATHRSCPPGCRDSSSSFRTANDSIQALAEFICRSNCAATPPDQGNTRTATPIRRTIVTARAVILHVPAEISGTLSARRGQTTNRATEFTENTESEVQSNSFVGALCGRRSNRATEHTEEHRLRNPIEFVPRALRRQLLYFGVPSVSWASCIDLLLPLRPWRPPRFPLFVPIPVPIPDPLAKKNYLKSGHHLCDKETQTDRTKADFGRTRLWDVNRAMRRAACPDNSSGLVRFTVSAAQ